MSHDIAFDHLGPEELGKELRRVLQENHCEITFTKIDGSVRTMPCTLLPGSLPVLDRDRPGRDQKPDKGVISVWCLDKQAWRSFRIGNVTNVRVLD